MFKKGDKVLCKRNYGEFFYENKIYIIESVVHHHPTYKSYSFIWVCCDYENRISAVRFTVDNTSVKFGDYFYTMREYRKLKMKKLNEKVLEDKI